MKKEVRIKYIVVVVVVVVEASVILVSHAADFNKKIQNSFGFKYRPLKSSTLSTCSSLKLKFEKP